MNNDLLLRQALQRQNERASRLEVPLDMEQRVMERIRLRRRRLFWLYSAIAASVVVVCLIGGIWCSADKGTDVCYTVENGQRITDRTIVMNHVETTLSDLFNTDLTIEP